MYFFTSTILKFIIIQINLPNSTNQKQELIVKFQYPTDQSHSVRHITTKTDQLTNCSPINHYQESPFDSNKRYAYWH